MWLQPSLWETETNKETLEEFVIIRDKFTAELLKHKL